MINKKLLSESKDVIKLAIPAVGEMTLYMLVWVFDTMMIGKYGGKFSISVVGFSSEIVYTFLNILITMGIATGITSIIARMLGSKNLIAAQRFASYGLQIALLFAFTLSSIFYFFTKPVLVFFKANSNIIPEAIIYIKICSIAVFFNTLSSVINGVFRGAKNTRTPLLGALITNIVNIFFDYALIFGNFGFPELGIKGAAIATSFAGFCSFIFLIYNLKTLPFKIDLKLKPIYEEIKYLITLSIPSSMQEAAFSIVRLISVIMVMQLNNLAFSANQIAITIESFSFMPGWGFATSAITLVGHSYGEKNIKKIKEYTNISLFFACTTMGIFSLIFLFASKHLTGLFSDRNDIELITLSALCLNIGAIQQIPTAIDMVLSGSLKGIGDTKSPFKIVLFCNWIIRLPLMYYFIYLKKSSITYFWWITSLQWCVEALIFIVLYRKKLYGKKPLFIDISNEKI